MRQDLSTNRAKRMRVRVKSAILYSLCWLRTAMLFDLGRTGGLRAAPPAADSSPSNTSSSPTEELSPTLKNTEFRF